MIDLEHPEKLTRDEIISTELIEMIFDEADLLKRQMIINRIKDEALKFRVKSSFDEMIKSRERMVREEKAQRAETKKNEAIKNGKASVIFDGEVVEANVGQYTLDDNGIMVSTDRGRRRITYNPVVVGKRYENRMTSEERLELIWKDDVGRVRSAIARREVVSVRKNITQLSAFGFPVTSENAKDMIEYLYAYEHLNPLPVQLSANKFGWVPDHKEFVPYDPATEFEADAGFDELQKAISEHGDYETWLKAVRKIRKNPRHEPIIFLAASFASVLVEPLGCLPFIVNLYGESGSGKTVATMLAASVWGDPGGSRYITEGNSTMVSFEQRLGCLNHLPMFVDDLSKVKNQDKEMLQKFTYVVASGRGKGRGKADGGVRPTCSWQNITITNIERPILDDTAQGGAVNRILEFEAEDGNIFQNGHDTADMLRQNYGFAGKEFIQIVQVIGFDAIREIAKRHENMILSVSDSKAQKQVIPMSIVMAADELTERYIFKDGVRLDFDKCVANLKNVDDVSEMGRAYRNLVDSVYQHFNNFAPEDGKYKGEVWGLFMEDGYVAIIPAKYRQIAADCNFSPDQVRAWAERRGLAQPRDSNGNNPRVYFPDLDKRLRCVVFKIDSDSKEPKPAENDGFMGLPEGDTAPFDD